MSVALSEHFGPWTIADVEALPDSGDHSRYELLAPGVLTVSPAPGTEHQRASHRLTVLLEDAAEAAGAPVEVLEAVNVTAPGGRLAIPDIVIVDRGAAAANPTFYPPDAVVAVVEIVSPGSEPHDRVIKPRLYAEAGIAVYWRFELAPPHIVVSELRGGEYVPAVTARGGLLSVIGQPFPVEVNPAALIQPRGHI